MSLTDEIIKLIEHPVPPYNPGAPDPRIKAFALRAGDLHNEAFNQGLTLIKHQQSLDKDPSAWTKYYGEQLNELAKVVHLSKDDLAHGHEILAAVADIPNAEEKLSQKKKALADDPNGHPVMLALASVAHGSAQLANARAGTGIGTASAAHHVLTWDLSGFIDGAIAGGLAAGLGGALAGGLVNAAGASLIGAIAGR